MKDSRNNTNIYVDERLSILEKVDKEDNIYYPGENITFTIICINNSDEKIYNILIKDTLPNEVIPLDENGYYVETSKGEIKQKGNIIEVVVDSIKPKEAIRLIIRGKVSG